jgi:hypothetical protein
MVILRIDGERVYRGYIRAGQLGQISGIQKSATSILPFKFQELELVGASPEHPLKNVLVPHLLLKIQTWNMNMPLLSRQKWVRLNSKPIATRSGASHNINIMKTRDFVEEDVSRSAARRQGGIMSGTHLPNHASNSYPRVILIDPLSTADEVTTKRPEYLVEGATIDPPNAPCAFVKVFYRPRGGSFVFSLQLS